MFVRAIIYVHHQRMKITISLKKLVATKEVVKSLKYCDTKHNFAGQYINRNDIVISQTLQ